MGSISVLSFGLVLFLSSFTDGQLSKSSLQDLLALHCNRPSVTLHIFSTRPNPVWIMHLNQMITMKNVARSFLSNYKNRLLSTKSTTRILGYQGFSIGCSSNHQIFVHGAVDLEHQLLKSGRLHLAPTIIRHVKEHIGQIMRSTKYTSSTRANCNRAPIRGPDHVPVFNPHTDNNGCFITKQDQNNCYAYATDIVTNTYPQPGRYSGQMTTSMTCESVRSASESDGLIYYGTTRPFGQPSIGHYVALLIWPQSDYHWIRKDANGYWSHKPGEEAVTNKDNTDSFIYNPSESDFSPWSVFCGYFLVQPSQITIR